MTVKECKGERVGQGGFGKVHSFQWKNKKFAVKFPSPNDREVDILKKCRRPNIVNLILFHKSQMGSNIS